MTARSVGANAPGVRQGCNKFCGNSGNEQQMSSQASDFSSAQKPDVDTSRGGWQRVCCPRL